MNALARVRRVHALGQVDRANTVDGRVMKLRINRELVILQAFYQVNFPQGPITIEQGSVQPRNQRKQLAKPSRLG